MEAGVQQASQLVDTAMGGTRRAVAVAVAGRGGGGLRLYQRCSGGRVSCRVV